MGHALRRRLVAAVLAGLAKALIVLWRATCRRRVLNDPRPALRAQGQRYVYALLHEHQLAAVLANDEPRMAAMVSRSRDGDILAAALAATGVIAVRGSSQRDARNKGGLQALEVLAARVNAFVPALIAVDGPRGPRGRVRHGIVSLAQQTNAVVLPVTIRASRHRRLRNTWDRTLIPLPFCTVFLHFHRPIACTKASTDAVAQIAASLAAQVPPAS